MPDADDIIQSMKTRKAKLQKYEASLKKFQYKKALNDALEQNNPEVIIALLEELMQRGGALEMSLANRSPEELQLLLQFITWKLPDFRYQSTLLQIFRFLIDMYQGALGTGVAPEIDHIFTEQMPKLLDQEITLSQDLKELKG